MTCREVADFLMDYVAGDLAPEVRVEFERHLDRCGNCREFLREYRVTMAASTAAWPEEDVTPPEELVEAIVAALRQIKT